MWLFHLLAVAISHTHTHGKSIKSDDISISVCLLLTNSEGKSRNNRKTKTTAKFHENLHNRQQCDIIERTIVDWRETNNNKKQQINREINTYPNGANRSEKRKPRKKKEKNTIQFDFIRHLASMQHNAKFLLEFFPKTSKATQQISNYVILDVVKRNRGCVCLFSSLASLSLLCCGIDSFQIYYFIFAAPPLLWYDTPARMRDMILFVKWVAWWKWNGAANLPTFD